MPRYVIDCDVHHNRLNDSELLEYLPTEWREYALLAGEHSSPLAARGAWLSYMGHPDGTIKRLDAFPDGGGEPGSDYELMRDQLLDPHEIDIAHLNFDDWVEPSLLNTGFSTALCRALNDWSIERWLEEYDDDRLCSAMIVPLRDPAEGAAEIRRVGEHPRVISAFITFNSLGQPLGHQIYEPVWKAAAELGLPIYLHVSAGEGFGTTGAASMAGGAIGLFRFEGFEHIFQPTALHVTSLIAAGVFERYPSLKVLIAEAGLFWLPAFAMNLDHQYDALRRESRWVRRFPSEYLRDHIRFATQPCEATPADREEMVEYLQCIEGIEEMLCFATDYPHWDNDTPGYLRSVLPKSWHDKVFRENAAATFRLPQARTTADAVGATA